MSAISTHIEQNDGHLIHKRFLRDPLGFFMLVLGTFILGYGGVYGPTPIHLSFFEAWAGAVFSGVEVSMLALLPLAFLRRVVSRDYYLTPSDATAPMIGISVVLIAFPFLRMIVESGRFYIPFEANFFPFFILMFFVWRLIFHPSDVRLMAWIILVCAGYKCVEGIAIFITARSEIWGLLTGWRDGLLLSLIISGVVLAFAIRPTHELWYKRLQKGLMYLAPFAAFVFIGSIRRSYILGLLAALPIIYFYLKSTERRRMMSVVLALLPFLVVSMAIVGADFFTDRVAGAATPTEEGSAAWRLIEFYNVLNMIAERPLLGWAWGVEFVNYTDIDIPLINSLIPHNIYLYALLRAGVIGLAVWLWFMVAMLRMHVRTIRRAPTPGYRFLACWMMTATLLIIVSGLTTPVIGSKLVILYPFLMVLTNMLPGATKRHPLVSTQ